MRLGIVTGYKMLGLTLVGDRVISLSLADRVMGEGRMGIGMRSLGGAGYDALWGFAQGFAWVLCINVIIRAS